MTKTLVSHSPACDMDQFRHDLFPYKRDQAARSRRRAEREETRRLAAQALLELAETRRLATASAAMAALVAKCPPPRSPSGTRTSPRGRSGRQAAQPGSPTPSAPASRTR